MLKPGDDYGCTGCPTPLSLWSRPYRQVASTLLACGDNLDAPEWVITGKLFWGNLSQEALTEVLPRCYKG